MDSASRQPIWSFSDFPYACLKDTVRTRAFQAAIRQTVRPGQTVVDAGAGTGILSFFAADAGAARVYAVEIDPALIAALRRSIALNGLTDRVVVVPGDAAAADLPCNVDVVIGELVETGLIEETQVAVFNRLRERGVIGPRTRVIPERYRTAIELAEADITFYGPAIAAPYHEWPHYAGGAAGWLPTATRPLTARVVVADVDLRRPVAPRIARAVALPAIASGMANAVRLSGAAELAPGLVLGPTNAFSGDKILPLATPFPVQAGEEVVGHVSYVMGGSLGSFAWRREG
jgi:predicted RNA methylase